MASVEERLEALEARVAELEQDSVEAELTQFRGRLDDLRVQAHLARMEAQDDLSSVIDRLEGVWSEAKRQIERLRDESRSAGGGMRDGARKALSDLRQSFDEAASSIRSRLKE